ncbi:MAG: phage holin family protein [Candidatus Adiutrix sp.]|jgi:toxin secretion/phage lysis holin|nr:phage holin family protein [Candidatus Adiutrix sp.]
MRDALYFLSQVWQGWSIKIPLSALAAFYTKQLGGGDAALLWIFSGMIFADLALGTCLAVKRRRFNYHKFCRWVIKVGTHFSVIIVVGLGLRSILEPLGIDFPLLDLFMGMLICTEALSILKHMQRLGLPVPKLAARILTDVQARAENEAADFFSRPENDRRRGPRPEPDEGSGKAYDDGQD